MHSLKGKKRINVCWAFPSQPLSCKSIMMLGTSFLSAHKVANTYCSKVSNWNHEPLWSKYKTDKLFSFGAQGFNLNLKASICTYDTFIAEDLTIDMISCQEQLSTRDGTSRHKYYVWERGIMLGMKGPKHSMMDKDLRAMTSQVQKSAKMTGMTVAA